MTATKLYYIGEPPTHCDIDHTPITTTFIDGRTVSGLWGDMCPACYAKFGVGLGTGSGQRYEKQEDGRFLKVEG